MRSTSRGRFRTVTEVAFFLGEPEEWPEDLRVREMPKVSR
jgi:hypothetical protein